MQRDRIVTSAVVAAVAVGIVTTVLNSDLGERGLGERLHRKGESKLVRLEDGGKGYAYMTSLDDGGSPEYVVTDVAPCMRALPDAGECWRRSPDGGSAFFGWYNRFPREDAVGFGCEPVACSIVAGENPDLSEDLRLNSETAP